MTERRRIREWMDVPGRLAPGARNSITDVSGVTVGHFTMIEGDDIRTGVSVVKPHQGNVFTHRCPAAVFAGNGHTKANGTLQIDELGEIESYIALTSTLSVGPVLEGLVKHHHKDMAGQGFKSINCVVLETNDGGLSDIMGNHIRPHHVEAAIEACSVDVAEGAVGAGTGDICFGYKGGIGTSSRVIPAKNTGLGMDFTLGALVQANFGGNLNIYGHQLPLSELKIVDETARGSISIVVATDAPMSDLQLKRIARRAIIGVGVTGSPLGNSSGDIAIAFSNAEGAMCDFLNKGVQSFERVHNDRMNLFFEATVEAVREAIYNGLCMAADTTGCGREIKGFDITAHADIIPLKK